MHFELRGVDQQSRTHELFVKLVVAENVAHVLAQKALDALPELLNAVGIGLRHAPGSVGRVRRPRSEFPDPFLGAEIRRHVRHQILQERKRPHWLDRDRLGQIELAQAGHAHEAWHSVDLSRARSTLPCLAVPAHREIARALSLDLMDGIENDHAFGDAGRVVLKLSARRRASPDSERRASRFGAGAAVAPRRGALAALDDVACECLGRSHHSFSSMIRFRSSRISGMGSRVTCISPPGPRRMTILNLP